MSGLAWLLWLLLSAAAFLASLWHYRRRETPGRGRVLLAALRGSAIALVLLLLLDPDLPAADAAGARGSFILLDASLSMQLPADDDATRWERAVAEVRRRAGSRPILLFGSATRPATVDALPDVAPGDARTLLLPGLQAAAEAGVRGVVVITDGGIEDIDAVTRWAPRLGLDVETIEVGRPLPNRALTEVQAARWIEAGQPLAVDVGVIGTATDTTSVVVRRDGRVIGRTAVPPAAAGRVAAGSIEVRLEAPAEDSGWVRLEVALEDDDVVAGDDVRTIYVQVGGEPAGIALVSFRPDWEPRFLAPVLERSLGLPLRAWLRSATGQYVRLASGLAAGTQAAEEDVRRAVARGQLVVLHGLGADAPAWAHDAARTAPRLLVFPADNVSAADLPAQIGGGVSGDFFVSADVPPSPVAPLLDDIEVAGAAPLSSLRPSTVPGGAWAPLMATRGRQGAPLPIALAGGGDGRRWSIALGTGYWQWAFRGGSERQLYNRLWSALGGWLAQDGTTAALPSVRAADMTVTRGAPVPFVSPGVTPDSMHVTIIDDAGSAVLDTMVAGVAGDTVFVESPRPGHYSYRARAFAGAASSAGSGPLTVETYSPELARAAAAPVRIDGSGAMVRGDGDPRRGRPLHASVLPWVLVIALLAGEWILRRRWGLR